VFTLVIKAVTFIVIPLATPYYSWLVSKINYELKFVIYKAFLEFEEVKGDYG